MACIHLAARPQATLVHSIKARAACSDNIQLMGISVSHKRSGALQLSSGGHCMDIGGFSLTEALASALALMPELCMQISVCNAAHRRARALRYLKRLGPPWMYI